VLLFLHILPVTTIVDIGSVLIMEGMWQNWFWTA